MKKHALAGITIAYFLSAAAWAQALLSPEQFTHEYVQVWCGTALKCRRQVESADKMPVRGQIPVVSRVGAGVVFPCPPKQGGHHVHQT